MEKDLQEQACWLLLVFESGLSTRVVNDILIARSYQLGRTLQEFFALDSAEWSATCNLKPEIIAKLDQARDKLAGRCTVGGQSRYGAQQGGDGVGASSDCCRGGY
jgi:hypothetical protein